MDGVVQEVNVKVPRRGLVLEGANAESFEIDELLFTDWYNSCRLLSESGNISKERSYEVLEVCECGLHDREPLAEVDCFQYFYN